MTYKFIPNPCAEVRQHPLLAFFIEEVIIIYKALKAYKNNVTDKEALTCIDDTLSIFKETAEDYMRLTGKKK